jgi:hypothetical protein
MQVDPAPASESRGRQNEMEQPQTSTTWNQWDDQAGASWNMAAGAVLASAVAAGVVAFVLRRARHAEEARTPTGFAGRAYERTREMVGDDRLDASREFLTKKVVPEFKPALLAILDDLEEVVDDAFRRAEKAIKKL